jgi:hypothetical protein
VNQKPIETMTFDELFHEVAERRLYDEILEPILQDIGERMEILEAMAGVPEGDDE